MMRNKPHQRPHQKKRHASRITKLLVAIFIITIFALAIALEATGHVVFRGRLILLQKLKGNVWSDPPATARRRRNGTWPHGPGIPGLDEDPTPEMLSRSRTDPLAAPFFSLLLSDGTKVVSGRPRGESEPTGPILQSRGGGGSTHSQFFRWWAWPLPPKGPLEFICQWPMYGITETRVGIDAQLILDAAQRSSRLWPEDES